MPEPQDAGTRVAHIGLAVRSTAELLPFFRDILGLSQVELSDSDGAKIIGLAAGDTLVELLESDDSESPIGRFMNKRGPGIHHMAFSVKDLDGTLMRCASAGLRLIDEKPRIGAEGKRIAFIHPQSTGGILIELSEE